MRITRTAAEPHASKADERRLRLPSPFHVLLIAALVLAGVSIGGALRGNLSTGPLPEDIENARRQSMPAAASDERQPNVPVNAAAGDGVVEPIGQEIRVAAAVPGRVQSVRAQAGSHVEAGDVLVRLESETEEASLLVAEAELEAARAQLAKTTRGRRQEDVEAAIADAQAARARAELSADVLGRTRKLAAHGAATPEELARDERQAQVDLSNAEAVEARRKAAVAGSRYEDVLAARAQVAAAKARRDRARAMLERLSIRAPVAGEVLEVMYEPGEYQTPGPGQDAVVVMGDTRQLRVRIDIDERDIGKVRMGAPAYVTANAYPDRQFIGHVVEVGRRMGRKNVQTTDPTDRVDTKVLEVVVALDEYEGLLPGQRVSGYVLPDDGKRAP